MRFTSKHEAITFAVGNLSVPGSSASGAGENALGIPAGEGPIRLEIAIGGMRADGNMVPVVQSSPPQRAIVQAKPEPTDQVQGRASGRAEPRDVPSIGRYLGLPQCD